MDEMAAAVAAVKDSLSSFGQHPYQAVNDTVATDSLARTLGIEKGEARQLCRVAVTDHLGGRIETEVRSGGLRGGTQRRSVDEVWWVDRTLLDQAAQ